MAPTPFEPGRHAAGVTGRPARSSGTQQRAACARRGAIDTGVARLEMAAASSRGRRHAVNEDAFSALHASRRLFVVADGVGGGAFASRASRELVERVHEALDGAAIDARSVTNALMRADREIARSLAARTDVPGAATVALCASLDDVLSRWIVAWVGDCRVYLVSAGRTALLTRDDTYRHLGEAAPPGGSTDDPARMVGNGAIGTPNIADVALGDGEMLVLCSDGVHKPLGPGDLARLLVDAADVPLVRRCTRIVALARARGGGDDATVLALHRRTLASRSGGSFGSQGEAP